ncbi:MAG: winged helix-turn-helix domain-containing protein [Psychrobium sp.]
MLQQDKSIQINQWVFSHAQSTLIKAASDQLLDESLESVSLNQHTLDVLWQLINAYPDVISAETILEQLDDGTMSRNKLYQSIAKLRRVFDDKTHDAQYIETVPRQGYRWLAEPTVRPDEETLVASQVEELTEEQSDAVHSGVLEQNIFDDLGFISDAPAPEEEVDTTPNSDATAVNEPLIEEKPLAKEEPSAEKEPSANKEPSAEQKPSASKELAEKNTASHQLDVSSEQDITSVPDSDIKTSHAPESDLSNESTDDLSESETKSSPWRWIIIGMLCLIIAFFGFRYVNEEPPIVFIPSDVLYVEPLTFDQDNTALAEQDVQRIQWWLDQKLQHLPAIKVLPYRGNDALPLVKGTISSLDDKLALNIEVITKQNRKQPTQLTVSLSDSSSQNLIENDAFNIGLTKSITGNDASAIINDQCHISDFSMAQEITPANTSDCLVALNQRFIYLITTLRDTTLSQTQQVISASDLDVLAKRVIKLYPNHSLGYEIAASYYNYIGVYDKAHEALVSAMERNHNSVQIIKLLSESYRRLNDYNRSIVLVDALLEHGYDYAYSYYWRAHDLVALGNLEKAQRLIEEHAISLNKLEQQVYFFGVNYNKIQSYLNSDSHKSTKILNFIEQAISDDIYCITQQPINECVVSATDRISPQYRMTQWQAAALYLKADDPEQAYNLLASDDWLTNDDISLASGADRLFYLPTYANILIKTGRGEEAQALLKHFIVFVKSAGLHQLYALPLAEAYALSGQDSDALKQMAQLLASGWLPSAKYQMWPLKDNPNLASIARQWQFLNLLELIENRRQLIRLRVKDLKKVQS